MSMTTQLLAQPMAKVTYDGKLRTTAVHLKSNNEVVTDAPVDNKGKGEAFSPTDLLATSLASCMLTVMAITAQEMGVKITESSAEVVKIMDSKPNARQVSEIHIKIVAKTDKLSLLDQRILENSARNCPVAKSLNPDIEQEVSFEFV